jgi:ornithine cyclodeaminase
MATARLFIDTEAAFAEAGDITQALAAGRITKEAVRGTLFTLCRNETPGRQDDREITLFKSVGSAIEDLAAATLVYSEARRDV